MLPEFALVSEPQLFLAWESTARHDADDLRRAMSYLRPLFKQRSQLWVSVVLGGQTATFLTIDYLGNWASVEIPAKNTGFKSFKVDAKVLAEVLDFTQGDVIFAPATDPKGALQITCGSSRTALLQGAVEIDLPKTDNSTSRALQDAAGLARAIRMALPCVASEDEGRQALKTIHIRASDGKEIVAATDGVRVMFSTLGVFKGDAYGMNIPVRLVELFLPVIDAVIATATDEAPYPKLDLQSDGTQVWIEAPYWNGTDTVKVGGPLLAMEFPPFMGVVPQPGAGQRAKIKVAELRRLMKSARAVDTIKAALQMRPDLVAVYAKEEHEGDLYSEAHNAITVENTGNLTMFVNPSLVVSALSPLKVDDTIVIQYLGEKSPMVLRGSSWTYVQMPMHADKFGKVPEPPAPTHTVDVPVTQPKADTQVVSDPDVRDAAVKAFTGYAAWETGVVKTITYDDKLFVPMRNDGTVITAVRAWLRADWDQPTVAAKDTNDDYTRGVLVKSGRRQLVLDGLERLTIC